MNIAYVKDGTPVRGVVYAPAKGRMFFTRAGGESVEEQGPFAKETVGVLSPITVSKPDNDALFIVASKSHRDQATEDYINKYSVKDSKSAGSSLKFCLVATGEADLYPRVGRTMEWDTAAGHAVLKGAGGDVVRFDDHTPLTYGKPIYENPFFIAYAPGCRAEEGLIPHVHADCHPGALCLDPVSGQGACAAQGGDGSKQDPDSPQLGRRAGCARRGSGRGRHG